MKAKANMTLPEAKHVKIEYCVSINFGCLAVCKGFRVCACIALNCSECLCFMMRVFIQVGT